MALGEEPGKDGPTACWPCCLPDVHVLLQLGLGRDGAVGEGRGRGQRRRRLRVRVRDRTEEEALPNRARRGMKRGKGGCSARGLGASMCYTVDGLWAIGPLGRPG